LNIKKKDGRKQVKPEELRDIAVYMLLDLVGWNPDLPSAEQDIERALTALQQAVDVQREEDARICETIASGFYQGSEHRAVMDCVESIRAGNQTVQEEGER